MSLSERDLAPCPFCGGDAEWCMGEHGDRSPWRYIACSVCEATGAPPEHRDNEAEAIAAWNRRALTEPVTGAGEPVAWKIGNDAEGWTYCSVENEEGVRAIYRDNRAILFVPLYASPALPTTDEAEVVLVPRSVLEAFVNYEDWMDRYDDTVEVSSFKRHTFGDLRRARAALAAAPPAKSPPSQEPTDK